MVKLRHSLNSLLRLTLFVALLGTTSVNADPNAMNPVAPPTESAIERSNRLIRQTDAYLEEISGLESLYGPYDSILLEPLQSLTNTYINRGDLSTAQEVFDRRIQIVRIQQGLDSLAQIPVLEAAIENDVRIGDWSAASTRFESIYLLLEENSDQLNVDLLKRTDELKDWFLHAILLDSRDLWEHQGTRIGQLQNQLMQQADTLFADDPDSLIPWLYQDAVDEYRSHSVRRIRTFLGKAPGIILLEKLGRTREQSISNTFSSLKRIRRILAEQGDLEGEAMAMIHLADLRLSTSRGSAPQLYRAAMDKLADAGVDAGLIAEFFSRPASIPAPEFHRTLESALAAQEERGFLKTSVDAETAADLSYDLGEYYAWHAYFPGIESPALPASLDSLPLERETVQLSFSLNSRGQPRDIEILDSTGDNVQVGLDAVRGIQGIRFRPQFIDRRWREVESLSMTYHYPAVSSD